MNRRSIRGFGLVALSLFVCHPAPAQQPAAATPAPSSSQTTKLEAGPFSVPLRIEEQYLGKTGAKTAVRFTLSLVRADLRAAGAAQPRVYSFRLTGEVRKDAAGPVVETFQVPVDVDLSDRDLTLPVSATFLQALAPGPQSIQFRLDGVGGKSVGVKAVALTVPEMQGEFRVESAGGEATAAAVILEAGNREAVPQGVDLIRILAPSKEVPIGLIRIECDVKPPVTRVEFFLEDKKILVRNRAPYSVELDLGKIPRRQTLKALGFDSQGNFIDADAWAINEKDARLAVRILELPKKPGPPSDTMDVKVSVQSIAGGVLRSLKLYLDDEKVAEWNHPPYTTQLSRARVRKATLMRASAYDDTDKEFADIKLLKGESRFVSSVEVSLVELNVSVLDAEGRPRKGLERGDFTVLEDGARQEITAFEFSESLPISVGIVIDGSGSMKESMPLVHQAAGEFVTKLFREKDQGFVMEFREAPTLLAPMSKRASDLVRAIAETQAQGATALYDSIVMSLYQFRSVPGKKALVILSDGKDNHSWTDYETLHRYSRTANVPLYVIGLDLSFLEVGLKSKLSQLSNDTGAEAFFVGNAKGLADIYRKIEAELRSQYFVTYMTSSKKPADQLRTVEVKLKDPKLRAKTIRGFFP